MNCYLNIISETTIEVMDDEEIENIKDFKKLF